jgi:PAS domain S-box-containing protein
VLTAGFLEAVLQQMRGGVVIAEAPSGRVLLINRQVEDILHGPYRRPNSPDQYLQYPLFHPDGRPLRPDEAPLARAIRAGEVVHNAEVSLRRIDGSCATLLVNAGPIHDGSGRLAGAVVSFYDITELREAQEALQNVQSELETRVRIRTAELERANEALQYQANLLLNVTDAVIATDAEDRIKVWNRAAEGMFGWQAEEVLGRPVEEVIRVRFPEVRIPVGTQVLAQDGHFVKEVSHRRKDGSLLITEVTGLAIRDTADRLTGYVAVHRDITDRKLAEEALRDSEARFRTIFERAGIGIVLADRAGRVLDSNSTFQEMVGYSRQELCGRSFLDFTHPDDVASSREAFGQMLEGSLGFYFLEKRYLRKDGEKIWGALNVSPVRGGNGDLLYTVGMVTDISERKRSEAVAAEREARLRILREVDQSILLAESVGEIARAAIKWMRHLVPCRCASLALAGPSGRFGRTLAIDADLPCFLQADEDCALADEPDFAFLERGQVREVPDLQTLARPTGVETIYIREGLRSYLSVPLLAGGRQIGALRLASDEPAAFTDGHIEVAREVADSLAVAIHHARLLEQVRGDRDALLAMSRRLVQAQEKERRAVARELHDETAQTLTALQIRLGMLAADAEPMPDIKDRITELKQMVEGVSSDLHSLVMTLRPAMLDTLGPIPALRHLVESFGRQSGIEVQFEAAGWDELRLSDAVEVTLYRVVQEAVTNTARHAGAAHMEVNLLYRGETVVARVFDDGAGFDLQEALQRGRLGLVGMRERVALLGGSLTIESAPGAGTTVVAEIPCTG